MGWDSWVKLTVGVTGQQLVTICTMITEQERILREEGMNR